MTIVDTHAHLNFTDDKIGWIERAVENGVGKIICVGTSVEASKNCADIAEKDSSRDLEIFASVGIHAEDGKKDLEKYKDAFGELAQIARSSDRVVAVGECGFDIRQTTDNLQGLVVSRQVTTDKEIKFQKELFAAQIQLASELKLPLIIHCRNAWEETFETLEQIRGTTSRRARGRTSNLTGVFHSWTGDWEAAQKALDMGFYISFSGIVTFKKAPLIQKVARNMPLNRMLLETDSPFLAPEPIRGLGNEPKNVRIVAEFVATLRNLPLDGICDITSQNAQLLLGI